MNDLSKAGQEYWTGNVWEFIPPGSSPQPMAEGSVGTNIPPPWISTGMAWRCVFYTVSSHPQWWLTGSLPVSHLPLTYWGYASSTSWRNFLYLNGCHRVCFWGTQTETMGLARSEVDTSIFLGSFCFALFLAKVRRGAVWRDRNKDVWVCWQLISLAHCGLLTH